MRCVDSERYWWNRYEAARKLLVECGFDEYHVNTQQKAYTKTHSIVSLKVPIKGNKAKIEKLEKTKGLLRTGQDARAGRKWQCYNLYKQLREDEANE